MKNSLLKLLLLSVTALVLAACGEDHNDYQPPGSIPIDNSTSPNLNKNTSGPAAAQCYEFPALRGGTSEVIVHETDDGGMTYAIEWDHTRRAQRWTCFEINADNRIKRWSRGNWNGTSWGGDPFQHDPLVPSNEQPSVRGEFSGSFYPGTRAYYNRGHICASEDRVYSQDANEQTFYMTNMMPQVSAFNAGIWLNMESRVRTWGNQCDTLYVCKGGTIDRDDYILDRTKSGFIVPRYFFMALLSKSSKGLKALGFWVEHLNEDHSGDRLSGYAVNIDELERLTSLDFFCNLPDDIEQEVESVDKAQMLKDWNLN